MADPKKSLIVGTAGHIDHGKSSLVEALTGTHPDRLEEEKRRGITIDLGFAFLETEHARFGFVDVPGHEKFVGNMLAGAAGIDLLLLVVAADESIKPQTREHFEICRLLGISRGIPVLTKADLVDTDALEMVRLELEEFLRGSFLQDAPLVAVSAKTGAGIEDLRRALNDAARNVASKDTERDFRLPIDRAFAVKGFGTVVTGTLLGGSVRPEDEVELFPTGRRLRVRGVQSGGKTVHRAEAGQRTAVNLPGIEHTAVRRGMTLAAPGRFRAARRVDVKLELLRGAGALKSRAEVHVHTGSFAGMAQVILLEGAELRGGEAAFAQLRLKESALVLPGDRFILRGSTPLTTLGGGTILDPLARRPRRGDLRRQFLQAVERGTRNEILELLAQRALFALPLREVPARTGWTSQQVLETAQALANEKRAQLISGDQPLLLDSLRFERLRQAITERLEAFHKENSLAQGMAREDLRAQLARRLPPAVFRAALESLAAEKRIELHGEFVKRQGAQISLLPEELQAKEQIEKAFSSAGLAVPSFPQVLAQLPVEARRAEKLLQMLLREKALARISPELVFHHTALSALRAQLADFKKAKGERISVAAFKDMTGISRKYAIPLLEYLDRERVTRRQGDDRVIL